MSTHHRSEPKSNFGIIPPVRSKLETIHGDPKGRNRVGDTKYKDGLEEKITIGGYKGEDNTN